MGLSVVSYIGGSFNGKSLVEDAARLTGSQIEKVCAKTGYLGRPYLGKAVVDTYNLHKVGAGTFGIHDSFGVVKMGVKETVSRSEIDAVTTEEGFYILTGLAEKQLAQLADAGCPEWSLSLETTIDVENNNVVVRVTGLRLTEKLKG